MCKRHTHTHRRVRVRCMYVHTRGKCEWTTDNRVPAAHAITYHQTIDWANIGTSLRVSRVSVISVYIVYISVHLTPTPLPSCEQMNTHRCIHICTYLHVRNQHNLLFLIPVGMLVAPPTPSSRCSVNTVSIVTYLWPGHETRQLSGGHLTAAPWQPSTSCVSQLLCILFQVCVCVSVHARAHECVVRVSVCTYCMDAQGTANAFVMHTVVLWRTQNTSPQRSLPLLSCLHTPFPLGPPTASNSTYPSSFVSPCTCKVVLHFDSTFQLFLPHGTVPPRRANFHNSLQIHFPHPPHPPRQTILPSLERNYPLSSPPNHHLAGSFLKLQFPQGSILLR